MDTILMDEFNLDPFSLEDPFGSFLPSLDDDAFSLGKVSPGDSWGPKGGPSENVFDDFFGKDELSDPLGQDWMESSSLDMVTVLDLETADNGTSVLQTSLQIDSSQPTEHVEVKESTSNSHILHELLTTPIEQLKPLISGEQVTSIGDLDMLDMIADNQKDDVNTQMVSLSPVVSLEPEVMLDTSIDSGYDSANVSVQAVEMSSDELFAECAAQIMSSPLSVDEVESILSRSEPASPEMAATDDPDFSPDNSDEDEDYLPSSSKGKAQKNSRKPRATPYIVPSEGLSKKERKKIQNKNAAIRYRMKKRGEFDNIKDEESQLTSKNKELRDKVDQISREIKYMKDLMAEVCKAKGIKITFKRT